MARKRPSRLRMKTKEGFPSSDLLRKRLVCIRGGREGRTERGKEPSTESVQNEGSFESSSRVQDRDKVLGDKVRDNERDARQVILCLC